MDNRYGTTEEPASVIKETEGAESEIKEIETAIGEISEIVAALGVAVEAQLTSVKTVAGNVDQAVLEMLDVRKRVGGRKSSF